MLLLVLAVLVPVLGLLAFTFVDQFQRAINNETQSTLEFARDNGAAFESYMLDISRQELAQVTLFHRLNSLGGRAKAVLGKKS